MDEVTVWTAPVCMRQETDTDTGSPPHLWNTFASFEGHDSQPWDFYVFIFRKCPAGCFHVTVWWPHQLLFEIRFVEGLRGWLSLWVFWCPFHYWIVAFRPVHAGNFQDTIWQLMQESWMYCELRSAIKPYKGIKQMWCTLTLDLLLSLVWFSCL